MENSTAPLMTFHLFRVQSDARSDHFIRLVVFFFRQATFLHPMVYQCVSSFAIDSVKHGGIPWRALEGYQLFLLCKCRSHHCWGCHVLPPQRTLDALDGLGKTCVKTHPLPDLGDPLTNDRSSRVAQGFDP